MNRKKFSNKVYEIVKDIPNGNVATYGMIAFLCGYPRHSRMVGQVLQYGNKPILIIAENTYPL